MSSSNFLSLFCILKIQNCALQSSNIVDFAFGLRFKLKMHQLCTSVGGEVLWPCSLVWRSTIVYFRKGQGLFFNLWSCSLSVYWKQRMFVRCLCVCACVCVVCVNYIVGWDDARVKPPTLTRLPRGSISWDGVAVYTQPTVRGQTLLVALSNTQQKPEVTTAILPERCDRGVLAWC